jgi:hypothetical protein
MAGAHVDETLRRRKVFGERPGNFTPLSLNLKARPRIS